MAFEMPIIASASSKNLLPSSDCINCGDTLANEMFSRPTLIGQTNPQIQRGRYSTDILVIGNSNLCMV